MKVLVSLVIVLATFSGAMSQDIIIFKDGQEFLVKILEVRVDEIKFYMHPLSEDPPIHIIEKSTVLKINYENGSEQIFIEKIKDPVSDQKINISTQDACIKGEQDATEYHKSGRNFLLGLGFGVLGIAGIAITNDPKGPDLTRIPNPELAKNTDYVRCYKKKAHNKNIGASIVGTLGAILLVFLTAQ